MLLNKIKRSRASRAVTTLIAEGTEIAGDVRFSGNIEVEGVVLGDLHALDRDAGMMRIMDTGCVEGNVHVPNLVVNGRVLGDVFASRYLELAGNAVVEGNVHYNILEMVRGAQINGKLIYTDFDDSDGTTQEESTPAEDEQQDSRDDSVVEIQARAE